MMQKAGIYLLVSMVLIMPVFSTAMQSFEQGQQLLESGRPIEAAVAFREALEQNPRYLDAWLGLAEAFLQLQELDQALEAAEEARRLGGRSVTVLNLYADVLLSLGRIDDAFAIYQQVLSIEPDNTDAVLGQAQIALAHNHTDKALQDFRLALERSPRNRTALLSLAIVAETNGDYESAQNYIQTALRYHNDNPGVHFQAARYSYSQEDYDQAFYHVSTALQLRPQYAEALLLKALLLLRMNQPKGGQEAIEQLLELDPASVRAWYVYAIIVDQSGDSAQAISHLHRALQLDPANEYVRATYESLLRNLEDLETDERQHAASYHVRLAHAYENENLFSRARFHYRRALQLYPFSWDARLGYAQSFERQNLYGKYLEELYLLRDLRSEDQNVADAIEIFENLRLESVSQRWEIDQFSLERQGPKVQLFIHADLPQYPLLFDYISTYVQDVFLASRRADFHMNVESCTGRGEAFGIARQNNSEYYLILEPDIFDTGVLLHYRVFLSRTGSLLYEGSVIREGAQSFSRALLYAQEAVEKLFPVQALVISRHFRTAIIDRGILDGLEGDNELPIYRARSGLSRSDSPGLLFVEADRLATFVIERLDDSIAEGRIEANGYFDTVAVGDIVVLQPEGYTEPPPELQIFPPLYRRIRALD